MSELIHTIALWTVFAAAGSVCYDFGTHTRRQNEWEHAHPGATYIRHYKRRHQLAHS